MTKAIKLTKDIDVSGLPERFRVFAKGINESSKGDFLFDETSAFAVMKHFNDRSAQIMIDLEHLSVDPESRSFNPDAMGWCDFSLIDDELWAVNVKWTVEGRDRLVKRKQRYISPLFFVDEGDRPVGIINMALCAVPALNNMEALVAASVKKEGLSMDEMDAVRELLGLPSDAPFDLVMESLKKIIEKAMAGDIEERAAEESEEMAEDPKEMAEDPKEDPKEMADDKDEDSDKEMMAEALKALKKLSEENKSLKTNVLQMQKLSLIRDNANKIPPAAEKWVMKLSLNDLQEYLKTLTVSDKVEPPRISQKVELSKEEKEVAKLTGIDPKKILEHKKQIQN